MTAVVGRPLSDRGWHARRLLCQDGSGWGHPRGYQRHRQERRSSFSPAAPVGQRRLGSTWDGATMAGQKGQRQTRNVRQQATAFISYFFVFTRPLPVSNEVTHARTTFSHFARQVHCPSSDPPALPSRGARMQRSVSSSFYPVHRVPPSNYYYQSFCSFNRHRQAASDGLLAPRCIPDTSAHRRFALKKGMRSRRPRGGSGFAWLAFNA